MALIDKTSASNVQETRSYLAEIFSTFKGFIKSEKEKLTEILSLFFSSKSIGKETYETLLKFYQKDEKRKITFFKILAGFETEKFEYLMNKIYAINDSPAWLISLAEELDTVIKKLREENKPEEILELKKIKKSFRNYFSKIFNYQYLITKEYSANNTPIIILKYIAEKEGVHPAEHWSYFEERLNSPDRMLLGLEHFKMPGKPIVYIEVAFSKGLIKNIYEILGEKKQKTDIKKDDTAIFYSVNNTFNGLSGIGLGEKMIIRAKEYINQVHPHIKQFSTLSPMPGFRKYLEEVIYNEGTDYILTKSELDKPEKNKFIKEKTIEILKEEIDKINVKINTENNSELLYGICSLPEWYNNEVFSENLKKPLLKIAKFYLLNEKRRDKKTGETSYNTLDAVTNFHLSNGAYIGSLNYLGNLSERGMKESFGMMVNYIYDIDKLDSNKTKYINSEIQNKI